MNRLNYFNPYQSKTGEHEDQLTRAYLVLLKHSSHVFFTFVEYCRSRHKTSGNEEPISIIDFLEQGWKIETQQGNPEINTKYLLSILVTDSQIKTAGSSVQPSERNARYDLAHNLEPPKLQAHLLELFRSDEQAQPFGEMIDKTTDKSLEDSERLRHVIVDCMQFLRSRIFEYENGLPPSP